MRFNTLLIIHAVVTPMYTVGALFVPATRLTMYSMMHVVGE